MKFNATVFDEVVLQPDLVLLLEDAVSGKNTLLGIVDVKIGDRDPKIRKDREGVFGFFGLAEGDYIVNVTSGEDTPYYAPVNIPVTLPFRTTRWPAYPDRGLADLSLKLDDENQPDAYKAQRALAGLMPTTAYPFPAGATLVRGRVVNEADIAIEDALVQVSGGIPHYSSGKAGEYVLFFPRVGSSSETVTLVATHPDYPDAAVSVVVLRGTTVFADIAMIS